MAADSHTPRTTETRLSLPLNGSVFVTTRQVGSEKPTPEIGATMEAELGSAWADSLITSVAVVPQSGKEILTITHARIPTEAAQLASNWEHSTADIGGTKYPAVQRTFILLASEYSESSPAAASAMPVVAGGLFEGSGYILVDRKTPRSGMQLEPVFKVEVRSYVKRVTIKSISIDSLNGKTLPVSSILYAATEIVNDGKTMAELAALPNHAYWGMQEDGLARTFQQLSETWYAVEEAQVVGGVFSGGVVTVSDYTTNDNYSWPAVLVGLNELIWPRREGGEDKAIHLYYNPEAYSGPCLTRIVRTWSKTPFVIPQVVQMLKQRINYSSPFFDVNVPECLHAALTLNANVGFTDQTWKSTAGTEKLFPATNYVTWPAEIIAYDDQDPYRGGYMRTQRTVSAPDFNGSTVPGKTSATITLGALTQVYDGTGCAATAVTDPPGKTVIVLYDWGTAEPINAGSYNVWACIDDAAFYGNSIATLVITPLEVGLTITDTAQTYTGDPLEVTVVTDPVGKTVDVTYDGSATPPTNAGSYAVVVNVDAGSNYTGSANATLVIAKAAATVTLSDLEVTADGAAHAATVATVPEGLNVVVTYDGSETAPTLPGTYAVVATVVEDNYSGTASDDLVIDTPFDLLISGTLDPDATGLVTYAGMLNGRVSWTTDGIGAAAGYAAHGAPFNAVFYASGVWYVARWVDTGPAVFYASCTDSTVDPSGLDFVTTAGTGDATVATTG